MKNQSPGILIAFLLCFLISDELPGQEVGQWRVKDLEQLLKNQEDRLYVINFWATWCAPCVKEMPHIVKLAGELDTAKVKFVLVSLDFPSQLETNLVHFIRKNKITQEVYIMMDLDYDLWINKVEPSWHGGIPAFLLFNNHENKRYFHAGELDEMGLRKMINALL